MPNLMKDLKKDGFRAAKNGFPQDYYNTLSAKLGQLLPVFTMETVPQGYYEVDVADIMETAQLRTKAFAGMTCNLDFYFVPYTALWSLFNQFHVGRADRQDAHFTGELPQAVPYIDLRRLLDALEDSQSTGSNVTGNIDHFGNRLLGHGRLMDLLRYGYWTDIFEGNTERQEPNVGFKSVNLFKPAAYQCIWYHYYRNKYYDTEIRPSIYNMDDFGYDLSAGSSPSSMNVYGTFSNARLQSMFTLRYVQKKKDLFNALLPSASFGAVQTVPISSSVSISGSASLVGSTGVDRNYTIATEGYEFPTSAQIANNDIFAGVAYDSEGNHHFRQNNIDNGSISENLQVVNHKHNITGTASLSSSGTASGSFSVLDLVKSEALQKWAYTTLRQGNSTREQMKGHHGVTPDFDPAVTPRFLGSYDSVVQINKVNVTANSSVGGTTQYAGQYVGQGSSSLQGKTIKFEANDFGIIMGVYSVRPDLQHPSLGLDKNNCLIEQFDFQTPELDNTGLVPVTISELNIDQRGQTDTVLGFAPHGYNLKQKIHECHGEFINTQGFNGVFSSFVLSDDTGDFVSQGSRMVKSLYISPSLANPIFVPQAQKDEDPEYPGSQEVTDIFYPNFYFNVKTVLPMSKLGLPQF